MLAPLAVPQCEFAYADDRQLEQHHDFIGLFDSCFRYM